MENARWAVISTNPNECMRLTFFFADLWADKRLRLTRHSCKQVIHKKTLESSRHVDRVLKNLFVLSAVDEPLLRKKAKKLHVLLQSHPEAMSKALSVLVPVVQRDEDGNLLSIKCGCCGDFVVHNLSQRCTGSTAPMEIRSTLSVTTLQTRRHTYSH
ncbi:hypothetical protein CEUSTIGMA_g13595.t1 [Chlamydomonas eustigma]|uniref:Uncharacterized protein n=1 Tax=Chlamydomonas eustigma TaxID=1157962 RepID=A0A250XTE1_9CHLO|nr:hypothetical protein CEUSTIGMA_g13595.t1 [Chlamydomonas eustigma]|eukprot:GAX86182.1 hypothetical protein CEUSTIGMA_g13595.t1 [Chlamydomonas eustigma]